MALRLQPRPLGRRIRFGELRGRPSTSSSKGRQRARESEPAQNKVRRRVDEIGQLLLSWRREGKTYREITAEFRGARRQRSVGR